MKENQIETPEELRDLKEDYSILKEELDKQKVINDRLMKATFKRSIKTLLLDKRISLIGLPVLAILFFIIWYLKSLSLKYLIIIEAYIIVFFVVIAVFYKKFNLNQIESSDIYSSAKLLQKFKKAYLRLDYISWGTGIPLLICLIPGIVSSWSKPFEAICAVVVLIIIITVAILVNIKYTKNIIRNCDNIINMLEDFNE